MKLPTAKWLISFQYTAVFYHTDRPASMVGPSDHFSLVDEHPAKFVVRMNEEFQEARRGTGERRGDMLHRIYFAIQVPDDVLTEDEADSLS